MATVTPEAPRSSESVGSEDRANKSPKSRTVTYRDYVDAQLRKTRNQVKWVEIIGSCITLAAAVLGTLLVVALFDHWVFALGTFLRWTVLIGLVAGSGAYVALKIVPLFVRRINTVYAARTIEEHSPSLKNSLVNLLMLRGSRDGVSRPVLKAVESQAATGLTHVPVDAAVDRSRIIKLGYVLLGIFVFLAAYALFSPKSTIATVQRIAAPWSDVAAPTRVIISEVTPGDTSVFAGEFIDVEALIDGVDEDEPVTLFYSTSDRRSVDRPITMTRPDGSLHHQAAFPQGLDGLQEGVEYTYYVAAGDARTQTFTVIVNAPPRIAVTQIEYQFPAYTQKPARKETQYAGIAELEGTRVTITAEANQEIGRAFIDFNCDGRTDVSMQVTEPNTAVATFFLPYLQKDGRKIAPPYRTYQIVFINKNGDKNARPLRNNIDIIPDLPPQVSIQKPTEAVIQVPVNGETRIDVSARDQDYALTNVEILAESDKVAGDLVLRENLLPREHQGEFEGSFTFRPQKYNLQPGDVVRYWALARDNRHEHRQLMPNVAKTSIDVNQLRRIEIVAAAVNQNQQNDQQDNSNDQNDQNPDSQNQDNQNANGQQDNQQDQNNQGDQSQGSDQKSDNSDDSNSNDAQGSAGTGDQDQTNQQNNNQIGNNQEGSSGNSQDQTGGQQNQNNTGENSHQQQATEQDKFDQLKEKSQQLAENNQSQTGEQNASQDQSAAGQSGDDNQQASGGSQNADQQQSHQQDGSQNNADQNNAQNQTANQDQASDTGGDNAQDQQAQNTTGDNSQSTDQTTKPNQSDKSAGGAEQNSNTSANQDAGGNDQDNKQQTGDQSTDQRNDAGGGSQGDQQDANQQDNQQAEKTGGAGSPKDNASGGSKGQDGGDQKNTSTPGDPENKAKNSSGDGKNEDKQHQNSQQGDEEAGADNSRTEDRTGDGGRSKEGAEKGDADKPKGKNDASQTGGNPDDKRGAPGAGENNADGKGAPKQYEEQKVKNNKEQQNEGNEKPAQKNEAPAGSTSKGESDSKGDADGDRSGGGGTGGGQQANAEGSGGGGSNTASDEGANATEGKGTGETGDKAGSDVKSEGKTGESGDETGNGSSTRDGDGARGDGTRPDGAAQGDQNSQDGKTPLQQGDRRNGSESQSGEQNSKPNQQQGSQDTQGTGPPESGGNRGVRQDARPGNDEPGGMDPDLDAAKKATDLILNNKDSLLENYESDQELQQLFPDKDALRKYLQNLEQQRQQAEIQGTDGEIARNALRNLHTRQLDSSADSDDLSGVIQGSTSRPPAEYADQVREYSRTNRRGRR
ncbi:MAG: hypothetical protein MPJ50_02720 [Pirellulales bacterium]|nr:hypothetical protein [Pirellulales bacterium]